MPKAAMMTATSTATEAAAATSTATELVREGYGSLVRGANSICVKNTFSCCACFKYNTQPEKKTTAAATGAARCKLYYF